jgi:catechol 2,3-dioxygenase-like lactoylglutathione lyase family enzyme
LRREKGVGASVPAPFLFVFNGASVGLGRLPPMLVLDHTIISASDPTATARFYEEVLGTDPARVLGPFTVVTVGPGTFDFVQADGEIASRHFAFRVSEGEFDAIFGRIRARGQNYWADPYHRKPGVINHWDDGRGVYFDDPDGHALEILTVPYGAHGCEAEHPHPLLNCGED